MSGLNVSVPKGYFLQNVILQFGIMPFFFCQKSLMFFSFLKSKLTMIVMLLSVEISQFLFSFPFFISSMDHKLFIYYIFWKQDPFVLTDACSGAAAKAQLDFLDCHARLVVYTLLSDKQNCSFGTSANNSLSSKRCNCWTCFLFVFFFVPFGRRDIDFCLK